MAQKRDFTVEKIDMTCQRSRDLSARPSETPLLQPPSDQGPQGQDEAEDPHDASKALESPSCTKKRRHTEVFTFGNHATHMKR